MKNFTVMTDSQLDTEIFFSKRYAVRAALIAALGGSLLIAWLVMNKPLPSDYDGTIAVDIVQFIAIFSTILTGYFAWFFDRNAKRAMRALGSVR